MTETKNTKLILNTNLGLQFLMYTVWMGITGNFFTHNLNIPQGWYLFG